LLTAVHNWMESLYTATEHFRCFGDVGDIPVDRVEKSLTRRTENIQDALNSQSGVPDFLRCRQEGGLQTGTAPLQDR
jgi:hypothetical protein